MQQYFCFNQINLGFCNNMTTFFLIFCLEFLSCVACVLLVDYLVKSKLGGMRVSSLIPEKGKIYAHESETSNIPMV
jgi:hypothetical protein